MAGTHNVTLGVLAYTTLGRSHTCSVLTMMPVLQPQMGHTVLVVQKTASSLMLFQSFYKDKGELIFSMYVRSRISNNFSAARLSLRGLVNCVQAFVCS